MSISGNKMNIAMLGHKRIPSREGGIEVVVEELSTRMARLGYNVTCYNRRGHHVSGKEHDGEKLKEYKGVRLKSIFTINRKGLAAMTSSFSGAVCSAFGKYDVVHFHAEGPAFMCWLPKIFRKRIIVTVHGLDHQRAKWGRLASWYIMQGEKNAVKYADEIIVLSRNVQQYFKDTYGRETVYIPNGVNSKPIRPADQIKEKWGLEKDRYILFLGRVVPEKGAHYLIKAFKEIKTDKCLVIAGGSSDTNGYMDEIKALAKGDDRILFTGFVQGRLKHELYSNAYVYVLPSDLEGMPLSLLEAMSYGNCCLTSDIDECTEVVGDKAVAFRKGEVDDLRDRLQDLIKESKTVAEYKGTAAEYILEKYNWDDVVEKTLALYKTCR
ncbi:glycosyltransferase family 4 protein [uncultured Dysosmobacter sp.]|uniref:glycosyltransferase family 4 protein n=1 Tax=uncultured Dysosmobacter sp. TaxID=2591384 RepID=UPI00262CD213|nr:glycosyltransferase family 4 protein [uncultured Dysosmobacter sp.]